MIEALVLPTITSGAQVLDLCCGTGQLAHWLTDRGYAVTGLDGSEGMLHFARKNAPEASFVSADARAFSMPSTFHAVVSTSDSLNHLLTVEELVAAFRNVYAALLPGGTFLCDMNTHAYLPKLGTGNSNTSIAEDDHAFIVHTHYDEGTRLAYWDITIFSLRYLATHGCDANPAGIRRDGNLPGACRSRIQRYPCLRCCTLPGRR